jgi:hypothetical protein
LTYTEAQIAQVCHEANRALQQIHLAEGDRSIPVALPWWQLTEPDRLRIIAGVRAALRGAGPEQLHDEWHDALSAEGWTWGPRKDQVHRTHPCLKPYDQLPAEQQVKDKLFAAIVAALAPIIVTRNELLSEMVMHSIRGDGKTACGLDREKLPSSHIAVISGANCQDCIVALERGEQVREQYLGPREQPATGKTLGTVYVDVVPRIGEIERQAPRVGDGVHYVSYGTPGGEYSRECRAAVVTEVMDYAPGSHEENRAYVVGLCVFNPTGQFFNRSIRPDSGKPDTAGGTNLCGALDYAGGTWHWPAR